MANRLIDARITIVWSNVLYIGNASAVGMAHNDEDYRYVIYHDKTGRYLPMVAKGG